MRPPAARSLCRPWSALPLAAVTLGIALLGGCGHISDAELAARLDLDGDGVSRPDDCDDTDPTVGVLRWYVDADRDGHGDPDAPLERSCEARPGLVATAYDCDDTDAAISPDGIESCNYVDDDCDGVADDNPVDPGIWYLDADSDGLGTTEVTTRACAAPDGFVAESGDCDDSDPSMLVGRIWYADRDGDGWGDALATVVDCEALDNYTRRAGDCDDTDPAIHPNATEVCDAADRDEDCDGLADDADPNVDPTTQRTVYTDTDGDGLGDAVAPVAVCDLQPGFVENRDDCDDTTAAVTDADCPWISIDAGSEATCGIRGDRRVDCWGAAPISTDEPEGIFREVAVGLTHACAVGVDDEVQCWGLLECEADGTTEVLETLEIQVSNSCGRTDTGALICWNNGVEYRLARADQDFVAVSAGTNHSCGLLDDGSVTCLGNCAATECAPQDGPFVEIATGWRVSCALDETGEVQCWGFEGDLQPPAGPLTMLQGYGGLFCALSLNGEALCWTRDGADLSMPASSVAQLAVGEAHVCARSTAGTVTCLGDDSFGQSTVP